MANQDNFKQPFIYVRSLGMKLPVTEQQHHDFYKEVDRKRKFEQYHKRCVCPKQYRWACDGDCDICEHYRPDTLSLDRSNTEDGATLYDSEAVASLYDAADDSFENVVEDRMLLDELFDKLRELTDDADKIIALWEEDYKISDRKIAETLGIPQRTFADLMKKYRSEARRIRGF